jgi:membrane protein YdbS with pleckstrin-like domain
MAAQQANQQGFQQAAVLQAKKRAGRRAVQNQRANSPARSPARTHGEPDGYGIRGQNVAALLDQARAHYGQRRFEDAIRAIRPVVQAMPNDFDALSVLGMALKHAGAHHEAADILRKALAIQESATLRRALDDVPASASPVNVAAHVNATAEMGQTLASQLDAAGPPGVDEDRGQLRGSLLHRWHRSLLSFLSFWLGLVLGIAGIAYLPLSALGAVLLLWSILRYATTRYAVYERRIDFANGVLFQHRHPVWLYDITDISMRRSPLLAGKAAIDVLYETPKKKSSAKSLIAVASSSQMREFMEDLQQSVVRERRAMKKMWI